ncbi:OmpW/AlkL family protein [Amantichitinum ursilacus]|uniref:Outer membrane protein W n=1 Tax=Amantichitinum ursilacus TaxID=857265 RepID=A0A0N0GQ92_9NEIS|nr:OmpW family outer membrane protein [Amantichitinum ursilacus]KPC54203.1 Outer membrane protein W precursor [Amantichitinum ursilacus]
MNKKILAAIAAACVMPAFAMADAGDIITRLRLISIQPDVSTDNTLSAVNTTVGNATVPELDFTYMFTNNIGAELILGTSKHTISSDIGKLGSTYALPPTVTLQYHFNPQGQIRPYAGVGVNYTRFYKTDLHLPDGTNVDIDQNSFGLAAQVGVDIMMNKTYFFNVDVKKVQMDTDVSAAGSSLGKLKINPWIVGVGFGRAF